MGVLCGYRRLFCHIYNYFEVWTHCHLWSTVSLNFCALCTGRAHTCSKIPEYLMHLQSAYKPYPQQKSRETVFRMQTKYDLSFLHRTATHIISKLTASFIFTVSGLSLQIRNEHIIYTLYIWPASMTCIHDNTRLQTDIYCIHSLELATVQSILLPGYPVKLSDQDCGWWYCCWRQGHWWGRIVEVHWFIMQQAIVPELSWYS